MVCLDRTIFGLDTTKKLDYIENLQSEVRWSSLQNTKSTKFTYT